MGRAKQWLGALPPSVILALGWSVLVLYAYPGVMTMDSFDQLGEARAGFFTDSHPPAMAALWSIVDRLIAGPFGMLAIQSVAFIAGVYLILRRAMRPRAAALWACAVLLFPPVLAPIAVIWKDCVMAGFLVLGIAAVLDDRRWVRLVGLGAFVVATTMRYNALVATLPLVVLLFEWQRGQRWIVRYAIAIGAWLAITAVAFGVNAALTDRKMYFWASSFALVDIVGTLAMVDGDLPDDQLRPLLSPTEIRVDHDFHAAIRAKYRPGEFVQLIGDGDQLWNVALSGTTPAPEAQRDAIGHAWWEILSNHPGAYALYRLDSFAEVLGLRHKFSGATVIVHHAQTPELLAKFGIVHEESRFQELGERFTMFCAKRTRLFRPHVYALLALALLAFCRKHRDVLAILLSGLLMELSLLPLAVTPDYRYSHWLVVCTCLALVMLIARRARERPR